MMGHRCELKRKYRLFIYLVALTWTTGRASSHHCRELVWLEQGDFAAWGCSVCSWVVPNTSPLIAGRAPVQVWQGSRTS
jgi:hypothetical protein